MSRPNSRRSVATAVDSVPTTAKSTTSRSRTSTPVRTTTGRRRITQQPDVNQLSNLPNKTSEFPTNGLESSNSPSKSVQIHEYYENEPRYDYSISTQPSESTLTKSTHASNASFFQISFIAFLRSLFLPVNYPHSVTPDYLQFQCWDTIQAMCSYLRGMLCTHAVLIGLGVGEANASATNATLNWVLRDGVGMIGGLIFAWSGSKSFGSNVKTWRLFADIINDIGLTLELISPLLPKEWFLPLLSAACICRSLCGVSGGATRAALMQHFALEGNVADLSAKEGSQETVVTLLGMISGAAVVSWIDGPDRAQVTWVLFLMLTLLHVVANYYAVTGLILRSINTQRAQILIEEFAQTSSNNQLGRVLTPTEVSQREKLIWSDTNPLPIQFGSPFHSAIHSTTTLDRLLSIQLTTSYIICPPAMTSSSPSLQVILKKDISDVDLFKAYFQALTYRRLIQDQENQPPTKPSIFKRLSDCVKSCGRLLSNELICGADPSSGVDTSTTSANSTAAVDDHYLTLLVRSANLIRHSFPIFSSTLHSHGWCLDHVLIETQPWRWQQRSIDRDA